jgi:hypothetical protein
LAANFPRQQFQVTIRTVDVRDDEVIVAPFEATYTARGAITPIACPHQPEATMRKITLKVQELEVTSFQTVNAETSRGTVLGHNPHTEQATCPGRLTCYQCESYDIIVDTCQSGCPSHVESCWPFPC